MNAHHTADLKQIDQDDADDWYAYQDSAFPDGNKSTLPDYPTTPREEWLAAHFYALGYRKAVARTEEAQS